MVMQQVRAFIYVYGARIGRAFQRVSLQNRLLLVGTAILVIVLAAPGHALTSKDDVSPDDKDFTRGLESAKVVISAVGAIATIAGGIILYLNFRVANRNTVLTESRLVPERFSKAVEQLGSDKIEVRLGGIYALERIAQDSVRDHWTIMEVLTAFVREKSPVAASTRSAATLQPNEPDEPASVTQDLQAALTVIGRRKVKNDPEGMRLDLSDSHLSGAEIYKADLSRAKLSRAQLFGAVLIHANLTYAVLIHANLYCASLEGANLTGANLTGAYLVDANLKGAGLNNANLEGANLIGANFTHANLEDDLLFRANLTKAQGLTDEQLKTADLCQTTTPDGTINNRDCAKFGITRVTEEGSQPATTPPPTAAASEALDGVLCTTPQKGIVHNKTDESYFKKPLSLCLRLKQTLLDYAASRNFMPGIPAFHKV